MNLRNEYFPDDPDLMPPARRRRARRLLAPLEADERAVTLDHLARRTSPTFDFFLFSLLAGAILGMGLLLDSPLLLVLGVVFAPLMGPAVGLAFGTVIGSGRFFGRSLAGLLVGCLEVLLVNVLIGLLGRIWTPLPLEMAYLHAQLSWQFFILLALGAILTAAMMTHPDRSPAQPSMALAYCLYLPLAVAGVGLGIGAPHLWPDGLVLFGVHLAWAALIGALAFAVLGFRPPTLFGYTLGGAVTLVGVILLIGFGSFSAVLGAFGAPLAVPTATPTLTPTRTPVPPTATLTSTPVPPTATLTSTLTPTLTETPTLTPSPTPLPVYALVSSEEGAFLRSAPGFDSSPVGAPLLPGTLVQLREDSAEVNGQTWMHVIVVSDGREGWIWDGTLTVATPEPQW
ncbi:MAG: DUF389 domain-containing protein [Anaerolineales bacterium]|nr:DUF389 domain-containing protein [Anaerolineales bacterium]